MPDGYLEPLASRGRLAKTSQHLVIVAVITLNCHASIKPRKKLLLCTFCLVYNSSFVHACSPAMLPADFVMKTIYTRYPVKVN